MRFIIYSGEKIVQPAFKSREEQQREKSTKDRGSARLAIYLNQSEVDMQNRLAKVFSATMHILESSSSMENDDQGIQSETPWFRLILEPIIR